MSFCCENMDHNKFCIRCLSAKQAELTKIILNLQLSLLELDETCYLNTNNPCDCIISEVATQIAQQYRSYYNELIKQTPSSIFSRDSREWIEERLEFQRKIISTLLHFIETLREVCFDLHLDHKCDVGSVALKIIK